MKFECSLNKNNYINALKTKNNTKIVGKIMAKLLKPHFESIMYDNVQSRDIDNFKVTIDDDDITIVSDISEIHIGWNIVKSVKVTQSLILIKYGLNKKVIIPLNLSSFKSENERLEFISSLKNKVDEKKSYPLSLPIFNNIFMKLTFAYSEEDEEYFFRYERENSSRGKIIVMFAKYLVPLIYLSVMCIMGYIMGKVTFTLTLIFSVCVYTYYIRKKYPRDIKNDSKKLLVKNKDYYNMKSEKCAILSDEGMFFINSQVITIIEWQKLNNLSIVNTNGYIGVSSGDLIIFWIPVSAFNNPAEKERFLELIKQKSTIY